MSLVSYVQNCLIKKKVHAVLKVGFPHYEGLNEIDGLKLLNGNPTVKLLRFEREFNVMLLEKCIPGTNLNKLDPLDQDQVVCSLLKEIWNVNILTKRFRPLGEMVSLWNDETLTNLKRFPDPYLAKEGCRIKRELIESTQKQFLLATDLHAGNILKAQRKPWLAIDIKPYIGDRAYDLTQHLLNNKERLRSKPKETIQKIADVGQVSAERLSYWVFARLASEYAGTEQQIARFII